MIKTLSHLALDKSVVCSGSGGPCALPWQSLRTKARGLGLGSRFVRIMVLGDILLEMPTQKLNEWNYLYTPEGPFRC